MAVIQDEQLTANQMAVSESDEQVRRRAAHFRLDAARERQFQNDWSTFDKPERSMRPPLETAILQDYARKWFAIGLKRAYGEMLRDVDEQTRAFHTKAEQLDPFNFASGGLVKSS